MRKLFFADTLYMKTCVILFAGKISGFALKNEFNGASAFTKACEWAEGVEGAQKVCILGSQTMSIPLTVKIPCETITESLWTIEKLLEHIDSFLQQGEYTTAVYAWADCPFLSNNYTKELLNLHHTYKSEYTFAEGFPYGITPEIIDSGTVRLLKNMCAESSDQMVERESFFNLLKTDINSFEIETYIAPIDLRSLRLSFHCATKRNTLLCTRMFTLLQEGNDKFESLCSNPSILHTLPSYYALQISLPCSSSCTYCPYPSYKTALEKSGNGGEPKFMGKDSFTAIIDNISEFSGDAVISLSLWGEAMMHPDIAEFISIVLSKKELSLVIETCSYEMTEEQIEHISSIVKKAGERTNGQKSIYWIVSVDAHSEAMYKTLHKDGFSLDKTVKNIELLKKYFNGSVYPQFMRLKENEDELEGFYRYWKAHGGGELIIQKYDSFSESLEDKKVADLTPILRNPCWHLRNDVSVLLDGTVPLCRSVPVSCTLDKESPYVLGNICTDSLEKIWNSMRSHLENHCKNEYGELCRKCDEYYTFNF